MILFEKLLFKKLTFNREKYKVLEKTFLRFLIIQTILCFAVLLFGRYLGSNENLILTNSVLSTVDHRHLNHLTHI